MKKKSVFRFNNFPSEFRCVNYILIFVLRLSPDPKGHSGELSESNVC